MLRSAADAAEPKRDARSRMSRISVVEGRKVYSLNLFACLEVGIIGSRARLSAIFSGVRDSSGVRILRVTLAAACRPLLLVRHMQPRDPADKPARASTTLGDSSPGASAGTEQSFSSEGRRRCVRASAREVRYGHDSHRQTAGGLRQAGRQRHPHRRRTTPRVSSAWTSASSSKPKCWNRKTPRR